MQRSHTASNRLDAKRELELAYARLFSRPDGEVVFEDLMRQGCFEQPNFSSDAMEMSHAEGRRSMALHIRRMVAQGRELPAAACLERATRQPIPKNGS